MPPIEPADREPERRAVAGRHIGNLAVAAILALGAVTMLAIARRSQSDADRAAESFVGAFREAVAEAEKPAGENSGREGEETNSIGMRLVTIPVGEFLMGSPETPRQLFDWAQQMAPGFPYKLEWFAGETPQHRVRITRPIAMSVFEVTKGQFAEFVAATSYRTDAEKDGKGGRGWTGTRGNEIAQQPRFTWRNAGFAQNQSHPVVNVSWNDAVAFCQWLTKKEGRTYRLPTEAEWEYACRAGTTTRYTFGDDPEGLVRVGNVRDKTLHAKLDSLEDCLASSDGYAFTAPVGRFLANGFGLYDMLGNAAEWCADGYSEAYYGQSRRDDPEGPSTGSFRVVRGGGWSRRAVGCRSASRRNGAPTDRNDHVGFRVVCTP